MVLSVGYSIRLIYNPYVLYMYFYTKVDWIVAATNLVNKMGNSTEYLE